MVDREPGWFTNSKGEIEWSLLWLVPAVVLWVLAANLYLCLAMAFSKEDADHV